MHLLAGKPVRCAAAAAAAAGWVPMSSHSNGYFSLRREALRICEEMFIAAKILYLVIPKSSKSCLFVKAPFTFLLTGFTLYTPLSTISSSASSLMRMTGRRPAFNPVETYSMYPVLFKIFASLVQYATKDSKVTGLSTALAGKQDTVAFNTTYNAETNKAATMADVTAAVAGLSGAMHYVGESTTDPSEGTATVAGHDTWAAGDVVTYNAKEFVYDGENWRELGDESSFAVKGSIKNADIASDAAIDQSKIAGLTDALAAKATPADITDAIGALDKADSPVANQVVTGVSETDGIITVTRRALAADDIPEIGTSKVTGLDTALAEKAAAADLDALEELVGETAVGTQITNAIGALDNSDEAVANQFVTAAVQTDGKVVVSRAQPAIADVNGLTAALSAAETNAKDYADEAVETALSWGSF